MFSSTLVCLLIVIAQKLLSYRSILCQSIGYIYIYIYIYGYTNYYDLCCFFVCLLCWFVCWLIYAAACCLFIICLSLSVFPLCKTVSVKNGWPAIDKRMLHWQPAKCWLFQLFIIYLANKVLLLLLLNRFARNSVKRWHMDHR